MRSFMQRQFLPYAVLCRLGGCFFIKNFWKPLEKARFEWKSFYTVYSVFLVALNLGSDVVFIRDEAYVFNDLSHAFSPSLILIVRSMVSFKVLINAGTMSTGSISLLEFFRKSSKFENITGFCPVRRGFLSFWRQKWCLCRQLLVVIGFVSAYVISLLPFMANLAELLPANFSFLGQISGVLCGLCYLLYDAFPYMVLRSCSAVLVEYLQAQSGMLQTCCRFKSVRAEKKARKQLAIVRHNLEMIRDLKNSLNAIFQIPLAVMSAGILLVDCVTCYALVHDGIYASDITLVASYCVYSTVAFMDMAYVSQSLTDEAEKLQKATKIAVTFGATEEYVEQLRHLHETIDPDDMCLGGGGFFQLNKSLLVSMAATMISYTVILSQTSQGLRNKVAPTDLT